jgi:hypothetical protein
MHLILTLKHAHFKIVVVFLDLLIYTHKINILLAVTKHVVPEIHTQIILKLRHAFLNISYKILLLSLKD